MRNFDFISELWKQDKKMKLKWENALKAQVFYPDLITKNFLSQKYNVKFL